MKVNLRRDAVIALAENGWAVSDIAAAVGYTEQNVRHICFRHGVSTTRPDRDVGRELRMVALYSQGKTLAEIGQEFGLTRERVRQLIAKHGVRAEDGGANARAKQRQGEREALRLSRKNAQTETYYGCDYETALRLNDGQPLTREGSKAQRYTRQRVSASARGIEFLLTFPQWWDVWEKSGKWGERGRGKDKFVMSRHGDEGPYAVGNVAIVTLQNNSKEASERIGMFSKKIERDARGFTPRQAEIHDLWSSGLRPKEIAEQLGIKSVTVNQTLSITRRMSAA